MSPDEADRPAAAEPPDESASDDALDEVTRTLAGSLPGAPEISGLVVTGKIGQGGMGCVYRARQEILDREVAVKVLRGSAADPEFSRRFQREATTLAGLSHPNIVGCYQAGTTEAGEWFLVMELIDGPDLRRHVQRAGPLAPAHALRVCAQLARALEHALAAGIIHRDVKPANVLLKPDRLEQPGDSEFPWTPMLADLGLARAVSETSSPQITQPGTVMGTPASMAPEQIDAPDRVDFRADLYGLGCVLYYAATGQTAFQQLAVSQVFAAKLRDEAPDPRAHAPAMHPELAAFIRQLIARDPQDRPESYAEVCRRCAELQASLATEGPATAVRGRRALGYTAGALAFAALAVLAFTQLGGGGGGAGGDGDAGAGGTAAPPAPSFTAAPTAGPAPLSVQFEVAAADELGPLREVRWEFGEGSSSREASPAHTFEEPGVYEARLIAVGPGGESVSSPPTQVTVYGAPVASFAALDETQGDAPLDVSFLAAPGSDIGPIREYRWDFGAGSTRTTTGQRVAHRFEAPPFETRTYEVRMVAVGPGGEGECARRVEVRVTGPRSRLALFEAEPSRRLAGWLPPAEPGAWQADPERGGVVGRAAGEEPSTLSRPLPAGDWVLSGELAPLTNVQGELAEVVGVALELERGERAWIKLTTLAADRQIAHVGLPRGGEGAAPEAQNASLAGVGAEQPLRFSFEHRAGRLRAVIGEGEACEVPAGAAPQRILLHVEGGRGGFRELVLSGADG